MNYIVTEDILNTAQRLQSAARIAIRMRPEEGPRLPQRPCSADLIQ